MTSVTGLTKSFSTIEVSVEKPVGRIQLNRPECRNAISTTMIREIVDALNALERDPDVAGVILTGSDRWFSAGADLNEALEIKTPHEYHRYNRGARTLTKAIESHPKPVIACVSGYCYTGGLELALACDHRVASEDSTFAMTSARIGSVAGFGGTQRLPRIVGPSQAKRLLFGAEEIGAHEAHRIGLVDDLVAPGATEARAREYVELWATRAPLSLAWSKEAVNVGMNLDLESGLDVEAMLSGRAFATEDKQEGMSAFLEKRSARFRGC